MESKLNPAYGLRISPRLAAHWPGLDCLPRHVAGRGPGGHFHGNPISHQHGSAHTNRHHYSHGLAPSHVAALTYPEAGTASSAYGTAITYSHATANAGAGTSSH